MNKELIRKIEVLCTLVEERWGKEYGGSSVGIAGRLATEILNELDKPLPEPIDSTNVKIIWSEETSSQQKDVEGAYKKILNVIFETHEQFLPNSPMTHEDSELYMIMAKRINKIQDNDVAGDENLVTGKKESDSAKVVSLTGTKRNTNKL